MRTTDGDYENGDGEKMMNKRVDKSNVEDVEG